MKRLSFDLRDKVAIISGGATGIGRAIADGLAEAGANLVICGRRANLCENACKEIEEEMRVKTLAHRCDVSKKKEIEDLVEHVINAFGHIDILVNNAGAVSTYNALELPEEEWDRVINTNLKGLFIWTT